MSSVSADAPPMTGRKASCLQTGKVLNLRIFSNWVVTAIAAAKISPSQKPPRGGSDTLPGDGRWSSTWRASVTSGDVGDPRLLCRSYGVSRCCDSVRHPILVVLSVMKLIW